MRASGDPDRLTSNDLASDALTRLREKAAAVSPAAPASSVGVEVEYGIWHDKRQLDFRTIIDDLAALCGGELVREGPGRYRLADGARLCCDGWYAELVTPPEPLSPRLPTRLANTVLGLRNWLIAAIEKLSRRDGKPYRVSGYSTHLNVQTVPAVSLEIVAERFALSFGPLLVFMTNRPQSGGIYCRPRPGRLEIATEYLDDASQLRAAIVFALGGTLATTEARRPASPANGAAEPMLLAGTPLQRSKVRYGWYLPAGAISADIASQGRRATVKVKANGHDGEASLQALMECQWHAMLAHLEGRIDAGETALAAEFVTARRKAPLENGERADDGSLRRVRHGRLNGLGPRLMGRALRPRAASDWRLTPFLGEWNFIVQQAARDGERLYVCLPRRLFHAYARGELDRALSDALSAEAANGGAGRLSSVALTSDIGIFRSVDRRALARGLEQLSAKKKRKDNPLCAVVDGDDGIEIYIPQTIDPQKPLKPQEPPQNERIVGNGVWAHNGAFGNRHVDHRVRSRGLDFIFLRYYRSALDYPGPLGRNWDHAYNIRVVPHQPPVSRPVPGGWCEVFDPTEKSGPLTFYNGTGRVTEHAFVGWEIRDVQWCDAMPFKAVVSTYAQNDGESFEIQRYAVIEGPPPPPLTEPIFYRIMYRGGMRALLNCHGHVVQIRDPQHNAMTFSYGAPFDPGTLYFVLKQVVDSVGRTYTLDYETIQGAPRLRVLTDCVGRTLKFDYDNDLQLERTTLVAGDAGTPQLVYRYVQGKPGLLAGIVNPVEASAGGGPWLQNTYDGSDRVVRQLVGTTQGPQPVGGSHRFDYSNPAVLTHMNRAGTVWRFGLKPQGPTQVVDYVSVDDEVGTAGNVVTKTLRTGYEYDANYHITRVVHPSGRSETFQHRNRNAIVRIGDELDDAVLRIAHHNDLGRDALTEHAQVPSGAGQSFSTKYQYEWLFCAMTRMVSPAGMTSFVYDQGKCATPQYNGNALEIRYPPQRTPTGAVPVVEKYDYAPGGAVRSLVDGDGVQHEWIIDGYGRVVRYLVGGASREAFDYDPVGNVKERRDARNKAYAFDHDARDLMRSTKDPMGHERRIFHDLNDRRVRLEYGRIDDPAGIAGIQPALPVNTVERFDFDILGDCLSHVESATGGRTGVRTWRTTYDAEQRTVLAETPRAAAGQRTDARVRTLYNRRGLATAVVTADGGPDAGTQRTYYDEEGRPALLINPMGERVVTVYDGHGRPEREDRPNGTVRHLEYVGADLRREWIEGPLPSGPPGVGGITGNRILREVQFEVDAGQRPIVRNVRIFDPAQRFSIAGGAGGSWRELTWFSAAGRLTRRQDPAGNQTEFQWNGHAQLETVRMPNGHLVAYRYDGQLVGGVTTTVMPDHGVSGPLPPAPLVMRETRTYDDLGREIAHESSNGVRIEMAYDSLGNLRAKRAPVIQGIFALSQHEYDAFSRPERQVTDHVTSLANPSGTMSMSFRYDLNGNLETATDSLGRPTTATYDGRDQIVTLDQPEQRFVTYERRPDGLVRRVFRVGGPTTTLGYTATGAPSTVRHQSTAGAIDQAFGYDGLDRLAWCTDSNGGAAGAVQTWRSNDSLGRLLSERTVIPQDNFDKTIQYRYAPSVRAAIYPSGRRVEQRFDNDGNCNQVNVAGAGTVLEALHQGPGRALEIDRPVTLRVAQPQRRYDMTLRVNERYDAQGRPNFRTLTITDTINSPGTQPFVALNTAAEHTQYEANGLPWRRDYGVISQPGASVDQTFVYDGLSRVRLSTEGDGQNFLNTDYDWDAVGRLGEIDVNARVGGQVLNDNTTMRHQAGQRIDTRRTNGAVVSTTTWSFDSDGRLSQCAESQPSRRRALTYDASDRLAQVDVFDIGTIFTSQNTYSYLYDAMGRLVARRVPGGPQFFVYDKSEIAEEFDAQQALTRRYVYDARGQLVHYGMNDSSGTWRTYHPLLTADGAPWVLVESGPSLQSLPTPPGAGAAALTRSAYYREQIPLIAEEHRWRPFEKGQVIRYSYSGSGVSGATVTESLLPMDSGGRRYFHEEALFCNGARFYDPALRSFITPDTRGAWGHGMAFGNAHAYSANNPVAMGDDGNHPVLIGLLIIVAVGAVIGAVIDIGRQIVQLGEGSRDNFSWSEVGWSALMGGAFAPALVFAPELAVPLMAIGLANTVAQWATGQIGWRTALYDAACMALPFGFRGARTAVFGRGSYFGRSAGPMATAAARAGRFRALGTAVTNFFRGRNCAPPVRTTAEMLAELGGREFDSPMTPAELESHRGRPVGSGAQGDVHRLAGNNDYVIKVFAGEDGAAGQVGGFYEYEIALRGRDPAGQLARVRISRVSGIGRVTDGRSFIIKEYARGNIPPAMEWLESNGNLMALIEQMATVNPDYLRVPCLSLVNNVAMSPLGEIIIFDPM